MAQQISLAFGPPIDKDVVRCVVVVPDRVGFREVCYGFSVS
jgi:hypothetical protein